MSSYSIATAEHHQFGASFDKVAAFHTALQNSKANFSVSHLLDLEELPNENCAMYANTEPQPGLPTQACTPTLNGSSNPALTDLGDDSPSPTHDRTMNGPQSPDMKNSSKYWDTGGGGRVH